MIINGTGDGYEESMKIFETNESNLLLMQEDEPVFEDNFKEDEEGSGDNDSNNGDNPKGEETSSKTSKGEENESIFETTAKVWHEKGLLGDVAEEDLKVKDEDAFISLIDKQADARAQQLLREKYGEEATSIIEAGRVGADPKYIANVDSYINELNNLKPVLGENNDDMAEARYQILLALYQSKGFSGVQAEKQVKRIVDSNDDIAEATSALEELISLAKSNKTAYLKSVQDAKEEQIKKINEFKESVKNTIKQRKEIIPGTLIDQITKSKMIDSILTPVARSKNTGDTISKIDKYIEDNPMESRIIMSYLFEITGGFKDWSKIGRGVTRSQSSRLQTRLTEGNTEIRGSSRSVLGNENIDPFNIEEMLGSGM